MSDNFSLKEYPALPAHLHEQEATLGKSAEIVYVAETESKPTNLENTGVDNIVIILSQLIKSVYVGSLFTQKRFKELTFFSECLFSVLCL